MNVSSEKRLKLQRRIDSERRIWIPAIMVKLMKLTEKCELCLSVEGEYIFIKKINEYEKGDTNDYVVDYDGRGYVTMSKEVKNKINLFNRTRIEILFDVNRICLKKLNDACCKCDSFDNLFINDDIIMCESCMQNFKKIN